MQQDSDEQRVLRWALVGGLTEAGLQPYADLDISHAAVARHVFETPLGTGDSGLLRLDATEPSGALLAHLRPHAVLSDGTRVRPSMVAAALQSSPWFSPLARATVHGDQLRLEPRGNAFDLVPLLRDGRVRFGVERGATWIGSGPYQVRSCQDDVVELEPNPHYPTRVGIERARCIGYGQHDALERIRADLVARRIDLTESLGREEIADIRGVRKVFGPAQSTALLWFNTLRLERGLRVSLAQALDRIRILSTTYANPLAFLAHSVLPTGMGRVRMADNRDAALARRALAAAGCTGPLRMIAIWARRPYLPDPGAWADEIVAQLADVGVAVEVVRTTSPEDYQRQLESADYDLVLGGWFALSASPAEYLDAMLHSQMMPAGVDTTGCNFSRVCDPRVDAMLQAFRSSPTREHERAIVEYVQESVPVMPLGHGSKAICARWDIEGIQPEHAFAIDLAQLRWDSTGRD